MIRLFTIFLISFSIFGYERILVIGDSLSAAHNLSKEQGYVKIVEKKLQKDYPKLKIYNGSVSGSTTSSLLSRMKWFEKNVKPDLVVIALGANDALRGQDLGNIRKNLEEGIKYCQKGKREVLLIGTLMPPNYGEKYQRGYANIFKELASKYKTHFIPFLLEGIAGEKSMNLADGIHPNEKGQIVMANLVYKKLKGLVKDATSK